MDALEDETVFNIDTMCDLLISGSDAQRTVVLFEVQQMIEHCFEDTLFTVVPVICKHVDEWCEELQISASEAILDVVQRPIPKETSKCICDAAFKVVDRTRTDDTFEAWGEILVVVLPEVQWNASREISKVIATLDEFSNIQHEGCRKLAARVLGSLSVCLTTAEVEYYILQRALRMADDSDVEVRGMVSESLAFIGASLKVQVTETYIWPKLVYLLKDPDARIHAATLRTIAHILNKKKEKDSSSALFKVLFPPVFVKESNFARKAATEDQRKVGDDTYLLLEIVSEVFGPFVHAAFPFFKDENDKKEAFKAFLAMATCNGPIVRRFCAFNLPGVSLSLSGRFKTELAGIVEFLSRDPDSETRWNLAAGIHKTVDILMDTTCTDHLYKSVIALLQDENLLIGLNLLDNFYDLLQCFTKDEDTSSTRLLCSIFQNLTMFTEGNWRTQQLLARQLEKSCQLVPVVCLRDSILPLLYTMAEESTYLVRKATMIAIAKAIWYIPLPQEREEFVHTLVSDWGRGGVFWMRIAFIDCAHAALNTFSSDLFSFLFAPTIYQLARDNVPNVRLRLTKMLLEMAPACYHEEEFKKMIEWLNDDVDKDVRTAMQDLKQQLPKKMKNIGEYRAMNGKREEQEAELEQKAERSKVDGRKRPSKTKRRASTIVPKLGALSPHARPSLDASPTSITIANGTPEGRSSSRLSSILSPSSKSKSKGVRQSDDFSAPKATSRKSLKHLLNQVGGGRRNKQNDQ